MPGERGENDGAVDVMLDVASLVGDCSRKVEGRYSFYSYLSSKTYSFLNPIALSGIKWIILRSRLFHVY